MIPAALGFFAYKKYKSSILPRAVANRAIRLNNQAINKIKQQNKNLQKAAQ
jgi:hypothetical protein